MNAFVNKDENITFLKTWISWWHNRRRFIFRAFGPQDAPQMNQAEVIHAGWTHRDIPNMSLLDVCQAYIRDATVLDVNLKDIRMVPCLQEGVHLFHIYRERSMYRK